MSVYVQDSDFTLWHGDALDVLAGLSDASVHCCVTSPPYWGLRDYGAEGQLGLEATPDEYVARMVKVFREVRRVLRDDGSLWLNLGDSYNNRVGTKLSSHQRGLGFDSDDLQKSWVDLKAEGRTRMSIEDGTLKEKDLVGVPWRVAFALQADGWYLRSDIIWSKPNPMPESVTDRPTKSHEYVFLLTKSARYFFDQEAVREPLSPATLADGRLGKETSRDFDQAAARYGEGTSASRKTAGSFFNPKATPYGVEVRKAAGLGNGPRGDVAGRNVRSVWEIATQPYAEAHFATYPQELVRRCVLAGCPEGGTVLDPFMGSGTTALVARNHGRRSIGIELNAGYCELAAKRLSQQSLLAGDAA